MGNALCLRKEEPALPEERSLSLPRPRGAWHAAAKSRLTGALPRPRCRLDARDQGPA